MPRLALKFDPGAEIQDLHRLGDRWESLLDRSARPLDVARTVLPGFVIVNLLLGFFPNRQQPAEHTESGVYLWLDGEVWDRSAARERAGIAGQETLSDPDLCLRLYLRLGDKFCEQLNGQFVVVVYDSLRKRLLICNDRSGLRSLFWRRENGALVCASEVKAVLAATEPAELDALGVSELLLHRWPREGRTLFQGVKVLPPASRLVFERGSVRLEQYWSFQFHPQPLQASEGELRIELARRLRAALGRQSAGPGRVGISLTSDAENQILVSLLATTMEPFSCAYSVGDPSDRSSRRGANIAQRLGVRHLQLASDARSRSAYAWEAAWRSEGQYLRPASCTLEFHARLRPELDVILSTRIIHPLRDPLNYPPCFTAGCRQSVQVPQDHLVLFRGSLREHLAERQSGSPAELDPACSSNSGDSALTFEIRDALPQMWHQLAQPARNDFELRTPLLDYELVEFAATLPYRLRARQRLLRSLLFGHAAMELAHNAATSIRQQTLRFTPGSGGNLIDSGDYGGSSTRRHLRSVLPSRNGLDSGSGLDLEASVLPAFLRSDEFPGHILDRDAVRRMVLLHPRDGRCPAAIVSGLLTLALVQQQFLGSELQAPSSPRGYPDPAPALEAA